MKIFYVSLKSLHFLGYEWKLICLMLDVLVLGIAYIVQQQQRQSTSLRQGLF